MTKKLTLPILTAATIFAGSASAFDPDDLKKLIDSGECVKCDLMHAKLRIHNLSNSYLYGANLRGADLYGTRLRGADLRGSNLREANLSGADLQDADLYGADMRGAILCNTTMPDGSVIYSGC